MHPIIGMTTSMSEAEDRLQMLRSYPEALLNAGAAPVMLPVTSSSEVISRYLDMVDGLLLSGGNDLNPAWYGADQRWECGEINPPRDAFEIALCQEALRRQMPVLGICRGCQLMNVAMGGSLYQDIPSELPGKTLSHQQKQRPCYASHLVTLKEDSKLSSIFGVRELLVNSHHHQAAKAVGAGLVVTATAPDGIIEAIEQPSLPFWIGVQWHPERLWDQPGSEIHARLFTAFVNACRPS